MPIQAARFLQPGLPWGSHSSEGECFRLVQVAGSPGYGAVFPISRDPVSPQKILLSWQPVGSKNLLETLRLDNPLVGKYLGS